LFHDPSVSCRTGAESAFADPRANRARFTTATSAPNSLGVKDNHSRL